ncbi:MAG: family 10 glycosylhydrolase [Verrucomicrobia bacterium]|nr:family 10 glycosylhydrolase [Verrucomicrobiota bacterium]
MKTPIRTSRTRFRLIITLFTLLCSLASLRADEFRAVWVDAWGAGFLNASQVTTLVSHCRTYNFNAVIVQMRRRGDAFYMPQAPNGDPRTTAIASSFDALQELINQCHSGTPRIEVHCWTPAHLIWANQTSAPSQPGHVYNLHPEYLMKNSAGATFMAEGYYLDPGHPGAAQWNYNMAMDISSRYNIDGFHWDYIRYPQQDSGYNETAIARYNTEFGLSGNPSPSNAQFSTWRRRQVTDFLRWTSSDLLAIKPNLVISASVFASRSDAFNARFQDWAAWNNEGLLDVCIPMNYTSNNSTFNTRTDDAWVNQGVRRIYVGPGAYLNTKENTVTQLNYVRNKGFLGSSFYSYRTPNSGTVDQTATFTYVRDNYQPTWQNVPSLPWKATPTKGTLKGTITRQDTGAIVYNATVTLNSSPVRTQKSEAHGKYAFFEAATGSYSVSATASGLGTANGNVTITAGGTITLNLVLPATDTIPPVISNVGSSSITDSSATITWNTDENSDSVVEYGLTTSYGFSESSASLVVNHTINLSGLSASTLYHYRVRSKDASNNESVSGDLTFTTLAAGTVTDIIIDNPSATVAGSWSTGTSAGDKFGTDYRFKGQGTGSAYLQYTPNILTAGDYQVYEWHPAGSNRTLGAPHVISYNGGAITLNVNQQINGGKWNLLGTFDFPVGTTKYVRITDGFADGGQVAMADAIKFVHVAPPAPPAAPSSLSATAVSGSQINLTWTDNSSDEANFIVSRSTTSGGPYTDIATLSANSTSYNNSTGLAPGTTYYYVVRAVNSGGSSAFSNQASATTQSTSLVQVHVNSITMSWVKTGNKYKARAVVNVVDASNVPVNGASVTGNFTGAFTNNGVSGTSNTSGDATITSTSSTASGTVTFSVTNITGTGLNYDSGANVVTSAAISR